uniref:Uncharacterized protein n=1 Tax=Timema monikensis TaxID=170555 RepID=A0A7R9HSZ5_9NEOP|nr:unnamed protein product [Timema monikensis]
MRMTSRCQYLDVWSKLSSLTVLALNYGYLSDQRGNVLLVLASVLNGRLATLQLLCLEDEIPNKYGGHAIPDRAWKTVLESCPSLQVHLVVDSMAEHSMVRSFISPSIPVHQFALFSGIQLERKRQWDMDVTFRVLEKWYSDRLEVVLVHLYRNNEFLDRTLVKLLTALPRLTCLELIGTIRDVDNVEKMCEILSRESLTLSVPETRSKVTLDLLQRVIDPWTSDKKEQLLRLPVCKNDVGVGVKAESATLEEGIRVLLERLA